MNWGDVFGNPPVSEISRQSRGGRQSLSPRPFHVGGIDGFNQNMDCAMVVNDGNNVVFFNGQDDGDEINLFVRGEILEGALSSYFQFTTSDNPLPPWVIDPPGLVLLGENSDFYTGSPGDPIVATTYYLFKRDLNYDPYSVYNKMFETPPLEVGAMSLSEQFPLENSDIVRRREFRVAKVWPRYPIILRAPYMNTSWRGPKEWSCYFIYERRRFPIYLLRRELSWFCRSCQLTIRHLRVLQRTRPERNHDTESHHLDDTESHHMVFERVVIPDNTLHIQGVHSQNLIHIGHQTRSQHLAPIDETMYRFVATFRFSNASSNE